MATYEMKQDQNQDQNQDQDKKTGLVTKIATGAIVAGVTALPMAANAAAELNFTGASAELDGAKTAILGIIGVLIVIGGIVLGWNTFRRSAH